MFFILLIILCGIGGLIMIISSSLSAVIKFGLAIFLMYIISKLLGKQIRIKDEWGMLFIRGDRGLKTIETLAKNESAWKLFADLGLTLAYGILSVFIIKRPVKQRAIILFFGLIVMSILSFCVAPAIFPFLLGTLSGDELSASKTMSAIPSLMMIILFYLGGFALIVLLSLLVHSVTILLAIISTIFYGTNTIGKVAPGATLILPGINISFAEGILALIIILVVHEGAHAVLAKIARIKILSSGVVLFGILPIGAFVEPDENMLRKLNNEKQNHVLIAGSTANLFTSLFVFLVFLGFLFATIPYKETGLLVFGGNYDGSIIYKINGQDAAEFLKNADDRTKYNTALTFETNKGILKTIIKQGESTAYNLSEMFFLARFSNPGLQFIYNLLGLTFSLNFIIALVNLLPLPFFDGYKILEININKKMILTTLSSITALAFLVNFLPWFI
ncbi:MAG: site-2 protease family protein [Candidatus Micrarchaeota archaeon]